MRWHAMLFHELDLDRSLSPIKYHIVQNMPSLQVFFFNFLLFIFQDFHLKGLPKIIKCNIFVIDICGLS